ncbi:PREDICTED: serine/threonine-protein kinase Nek11-like, partial [Eurypyga helias]|uniref:serine/threonine-protein kinase Nek11-like n=1 Tax=Eurypyga helias TaxID=54383 RepID=UPI0005280AAD
TVCWPGCVSKRDSASQQGFADERQKVFPRKVCEPPEAWAQQRQGSCFLYCGELAYLLRKVLKEISVGDLKPNETVEANLEAQLLSKLDHPAIVKFYASFVERDSFCIITEYCEGGDLDFKIQDYKESGKTFTQRQIIDWFIQLLLGVNYMHERRILHRDLKAKNIFLKNNLLKIGDFGVSRLLIGSCDLATTFTGTPYYMSPEALKHQGYNTKSDIW